ncbi:proline-rich protein 36-like isoform X2 [Anneissia japonica]|nr:proline-rich protein 36-like isoform X2 [Anneissia japonica]XP_033100028.1 proline-rich protein 36-like isoform X2 [Anneissia japonica]
MDPTVQKDVSKNDNNTTKSINDFIERHFPSAPPLTSSPVNLACRPSEILPSSQSHLPSSRESSRASSHPILTVTQSPRVPPPVAPKPRQPPKITRIGQENGSSPISSGGGPLLHPPLSPLDAVAGTPPMSLPVNSVCKPPAVLQSSQSLLTSSRDSSRACSQSLFAVIHPCRVPPPVPPKPCKPLKITRTGHSSGSLSPPPPWSPVNSGCRPSAVLPSSLRSLLPSSGDSMRAALQPLLAATQSAPVPPPVAPKPCQPRKITRPGQANGPQPLSRNNGHLTQPLLPPTSAAATPPPTSPRVNSAPRPSKVLQSSRNLSSSGDSSTSSLHPLLAIKQSSRVPPPVAPKPCQPPKITKVPPPVAAKPCQPLKITRPGQASGPQPLPRGHSPLSQPLLHRTSTVATPPPTSPALVNSVCRPSTVLQSSQNLLHSSGDSAKASLHPLLAVTQSSRVPPPVAPKPCQPSKITKVPPPVAPKPCQPLKITRPVQANGPQPPSRSNSPLSQPLLPPTSTVATPPPTSPAPVNSACRPSTVLKSSKNLIHSSGDSSKASLHPLSAVKQSSRGAPPVAPKPCPPPKSTKPGQGRKPPPATMTGPVLRTSLTLEGSGQNRRNNVVQKKTVEFQHGFDLVQVQEEKKNFLMIQSLVIDVGTEQMRKYFLKETGVKRENVGQFLIQEQDGSLKNIKLVLDQKQIMYKKDADIRRFDITIMMILIRYCCNVSQPDKFWGNPRRKDKSKLANLVRIQKYRNTKIAHNPDLRIPAAEFKKDWRTLTSIFKGLGVTPDEINKYRQIDI